METKVRYYRFINGELTQNQLAEKLGVSRQTIAAIEKGNYSPSVWLALKMAAFFKVQVENLFILKKEEIDD